ncbi:MAG: hypothetical protein L6R43_15830 [Planctomycetes bacterium]|nr:hypothetical protein [Planctomycetota bacterium]
MENDPRLPAGYAVVREGGTVLVLREGHAGPLAAAGVADPEAAAAAAGGEARTFQGRGKPVSFPVPGSPGLRVVARRYLHGGLLRGLTGGLFPGAGRFLRELRLLDDLRREGAPVPEPLGIVVRPAGAGVARGWLLTREVPGCEDLRSLLLRLPPGDPARRSALREAGRAVRAIHDAGILHADLHVKNLLLPLAGGPATVLDLDGAERVEGGLSREQRAVQILRLDRSLVKLGAKSGAPVPRTDRRRLVRAWLGGDRLPREESLRWRRRQRAELARHRLLW